LRPPGELSDGTIWQSPPHLDWVRVRMHLRRCHNFHDFRRLAKRRLPGPIFDYIDGAADDEVTHRRNTSAFEHKAPQLV
jgi:FMN-dependent dehydrogenase